MFVVTLQLEVALLSNLTSGSMTHLQSFAQHPFIGA